jgi:hypothetical protein
MKYKEHLKSDCRNDDTKDLFLIIIIAKEVSKNLDF